MSYDRVRTYKHSEKQTDKERLQLWRARVAR